MKVSIIVPVYNVSPYIEKCLASISAQTYENIECILVDDKGTDDSVNKCNRFIAAYHGKKKFQLISNPENLGPSGSRNNGTEKATGDFVFYLDGDDYITETCIEEMIDIYLKHPDADFIQGMISCPGKTKNYDFPVLKESEYINNKDWISKHFFRNSFPVTAWNKLIKRDFIYRKNLFFEPGILNEDELWTYKLCSVVERFGIAQKETYVHVINPVSIMSTDSIKRSSFYWGIILEKILSSPAKYYWNLALLRYLTIFLRYYKTPYADAQTYSRLLNMFESELKWSGMGKLDCILKLYSNSSLIVSRYLKWITIKYINHLARRIH